MQLLILELIGPKSLANTERHIYVEAAHYEKKPDIPATFASSFELQVYKTYLCLAESETSQFLLSCLYFCHYSAWSLDESLRCSISSPVIIHTPHHTLLERSVYNILGLYLPVPPNPFHSPIPASKLLLYFQVHLK